jgi:hypothetical protein
VSIVDHGPVRPPYGTPERAEHDATHGPAPWAAAWLVWSNQRGMWWRADERGYTSFLHEAGRYTRDQAEAIVAKASCDGQLVRTRVDPVTGKEHKFLDEVMIPAPEVLK